MISKSPKEIYQTTCKRLQDEGVDITEDTVKQFNLFLFGKINSTLMSLEALELVVPQLGLWKFRRKKGEEYYKEIENSPVAALLGHREPEIIERAVDTFNDRLNRLGALIEQHEDMIIARKEFKKIKDDFSTNKRRTEGQKENLGGSEEQHVEKG